MKSILKDLYHQIYPSYLHALTKAVGDCETLLDVGCGAYSPLQSLRRKPYCTGVDAFEPSIKASRSKGIHDEYRQLNILELENNLRKFLRLCTFERCYRTLGKRGWSKIDTDVGENCKKACNYFYP